MLFSDAPVTKVCFNLGGLYYQTMHGGGCRCVSVCAMRHLPLRQNQVVRTHTHTTHVGPCVGIWVHTHTHTHTHTNRPVSPGHGGTRRDLQRGSLLRGLNGCLWMHEWVECVIVLKGGRHFHDYTKWVNDLGNEEWWPGVLSGHLAGSLT